MVESFITNHLQSNRLLVPKKKLFAAYLSQSSDTYRRTVESSKHSLLSKISFSVSVQRAIKNGDFLFQTGWMSKHKSSRWIPLLVHCTVYTLTVSFVSWITFGGLSYLAIAFIFVTHIILDRRTFVQWWVRTIMQAKGPESKWLSIVADQIFHLIVLAFALSM